MRKEKQIKRRGCVPLLFTTFPDFVKNRSKTFLDFVKNRSKTFPDSVKKRLLCSF